MCTPTDIIGGVLQAGRLVTKSVSDYSNLKANNEYRTQVALNNAKIAQNEALKQKQIGIEKSRLEKISSMQDVAKLQAKSAASNFDTSSQTNKYNYQDVLNSAQLQSKYIQKEYDLQANEYFNQANSYINQAKDYNRQYKNSLKNFAYNVLDDSAQVSKSWYDIYKDRQKGGL